MNLLLDTHILIWLTSDRQKLGPYTQTLLEDNSNRLYVSYFSLFELYIKAQ